MALDLADIALVLIPDDGPALDVIDRQIQECGSEHVAFLERKRSRSQGHVLYEEPQPSASIFTSPVLVLRYSLWQYRFGSFMDSGDSNIILPFDFVSSEQFEIYFDTQDLKASIRFCNGTTLLDGKAFAEGATTDLKNGQKIEIEDVVFKVTTIRASAGTESSPGPKNDVQKEQRQSKLKGETLVNIPTLTSPHKDAMFNALPSQTIQQDSERVVQRPMLMPQIRLDSPTDGGSNTLTEGLPKLEDWRRGDFVGKGGYGQVFKHKPRHSAEVLAVKVVNFPEITPAWRRDIDKTEQIKDFNHKMTYIDREVDILLKVDHRFVLRAHQVFRYPEGLAIVTLYFQEGELGSLAEYPPHGKAWSLPLSDARSISGQILSGIDYLHELGYMHRDLKPANVLLRNLDPLEVVISDHGFAQESSRATTRAGSRLWSAPECFWGEADQVYDLSVDMYSMGVILLWLLGVYPEDGEYISERVYDKLFGDKIRKAVSSSNSLEETTAISAGQTMAAYLPKERPTIESCWELAFFNVWQPPPVKEALDHTTAFESKDSGLTIDGRGDAGGSGGGETIHKAQTGHKKGLLKVRRTSVLAHSSKGPANLGVQQPARVQKNRSKVPISDGLLEALSRTSLTKDTR